MLILSLILTLAGCDLNGADGKSVNAERDLTSTDDTDSLSDSGPTGGDDTGEPSDTDPPTGPDDTDPSTDPDDRDGDGYTPDEGDCDDDDSARYPTAADTYGDGVDQNCDGLDGWDRDGDGFASEESGGDDCNDTNPAWNPEAFDLFGDDVDSNCDGIDGVDADGDSFIDAAVGGDDCDDSDASIHPGADEIPGDGIDQDCDSRDPDAPDDPVVTTVSWDCDEDGYSYAFKTSSVATGGSLYIYQTGSSSPWDEFHPVSVLSTDPGDTWTELGLDLESVYPDVGAVSSGVSTLYACDEGGMQYTLTWVLEVDSTSAAGVSCAVWGHNPEAVTSAAACTIF